jgi:hypothetical protein
LAQEERRGEERRTHEREEEWGQRRVGAGQLLEERQWGTE